MSEINMLLPGSEMPLSEIPWEERFGDHKNKIEEYLQNCTFRGCNVESTVYQRKIILQSIFRRVDINDSTHPRGQRQLLVWELLSPSLGPHYLSRIVTSLLNDDTAPGTRRTYMNALRSFCDYVLAKPHIPGHNGLSIPDTYGPIAKTFTKYDLPVHAADRPRRKRFALSPAVRDDFFEFLRTDYLTNHSLPHIGARDYTAVILQAEIGARVSELVGIRSGGEACDIDRVKGRVRLLGKAKAYSGKRPRWVPLTRLAAEVLNTFEKVFKPMFPKSPHSDYLFLNEDGSPLPKFRYWINFRKIILLARKSGVRVPETLRPHDLRRTFATNELQKNPLAYRKVLKQLGHSYASSAAPYLIATDQDVEEQQNDLIDIFVDPDVDQGENN